MLITNIFSQILQGADKGLLCPRQVMQHVQFNIVKIITVNNSNSPLLSVNSDIIIGILVL